MDKSTHTKDMNTVYHIYNLNQDLRIGQINGPIDQLLTDKALDTWAFISACIPPTTVGSKTDNNKRHQNLLSLVNEFPYYEGEFNSMDESWAPERGVLILGISQEKALEYAKQFSQTSIGWGRVNKPAELIKIDYSTFSIQRDQAKISSFMRQLNSGKSFGELDEDTMGWWMSRY